ncbi:CoA transferase [Gilvimarinus sp. F26214L]|uniref:CoA transferase n=1 Tax=Gilvimarinus sp. DZF01 TaxID=3461371 RepID=UPI0040466C0C
MNGPTDNTGMLSGYRVLDLSDHRAFACAKFLASLGAEVIRIDPPSSRPNQGWRLRNMGKQSITLNLDAETGRAYFQELVRQSHFVVESFTPGYLAERHLDYARLEQINPQVIWVSITPFGQSGPFSQYKGGELVASAMGGTLDTCGYPDETPVLEARDACCFHATAAASLGALLAHRERGISGRGQHVDCSIQEVAASRNTSNLLAWQFDRRKLLRAGDKVRFGRATVRVVWELADGYCFHSLMTGKFGAPANAALSAWMSEEGFANPMAKVDWERYDRSSLAPETRLEWEAAMDAFFNSKTKDDIRTEGAKRGIRATVANSPDDVLKDQHLRSREFLQPVALASGVTLEQPDYFVRLSEGHYRMPHVIPTLGGHNHEVYSRLLGLSVDELKQQQAAGVL